MKRAVFAIMPHVVCIIFADGQDLIFYNILTFKGNEIQAKIPPFSSLCRKNRENGRNEAQLCEISLQSKVLF